MSIFSLIIIIVIILIVPPRVFASPLSLSISPPLLEVVGQEGEPLKANIEVSNRGEQPLVLEVMLIPFEGGEAEVKDFIVLEDEGVPTAEIALKPQEIRSLTLHMVLPKAEERDYYFSVVFVNKAKALQETVKEGELKAQSAISAGIGTNVLLSLLKKGEAKMERANLRIVEFSSPRFLENGPLSLRVKLRNEGNHFVRTKGVVTITNLFGEKFTLSLAETIILAKSSRILAPITYEEPFLLGPYTVTLAVADLTAQTSFFAFPIRQLGLMLLLLLTFALVRRKVQARISTQRWAKVKNRRS